MAQSPSNSTGRHHRSAAAFANPFHENSRKVSRGEVAAVRALSGHRPLAPVVAGTSAGTQLPDVHFLLVDDCMLYRDNLASVLLDLGASQLAVAQNLTTLRSAVSQVAPEMVVLNMGSRESLALLDFLRRECPEARVIVVGISEDDEAQVIACAEAGVAGYHMRMDSLDDLLSLITSVAAGEAVCSREISAILLRRLSDLAAQRHDPAEWLLTAREAEILNLLELGLSNRDIATELCIAVHTVKNHVHSLLNKLGVRTRAQAAALSRSMGPGPIHNGNRSSYRKRLLVSEI
ncbi:response regulator transcription factor [Mycobacterium sp. GA-2829]|uniref:LuxR C-terminal-related transcriptional regulator n=1 Tax=Mycobacterium sp. GA-2829 TaxID=1772283 RepID=UPI000A51E960|nr:response regulator transcription factor [Mycobacterium sp. GA-2829]